MGMSAALAAAQAGLSVVILEETRKIRGMSAYSGAGAWIPANHHAQATEVADSVEGAIACLHVTAPEGSAANEGPLWRSFAANAPQALALIERATPLRFELLDRLDRFPEAAGGKPKGRMLSPRPLSRSLIGTWARHLRTSRFPQVLTYAEMYPSEPMYAGWGRRIAMAPKLLRRLPKGERGLGGLERP